MLGDVQAAVGEIFSVLRSVVDVVLVVGVPVFGFLLRRLVDQFDRRIAALEETSRASQIGQVVGDGKIREQLANDYVSAEECKECRRETRETTTRIFTKVEGLQVGQGRIEGEMKGLAAAVTGLAAGVGRLAAGD